MSESLLVEQLSRNTQFFGDKGQNLIQNSFVIVVGLGGVGSHVAHMLARAGVRRLRLIDFDNVTLSSLNRHAVATRADVGTPKVQACKRHFEEIIPKEYCTIEAVNSMFTGEAADQLLSGDPDFVVDAIDDTNTKSDLIKACKDAGVKFIVSMGAGAKSDPSRIHISDISDALADPLAVKVRSLLKARGVEMAKHTSIHDALKNGVPCVYSSEKSTRKLLDLTPEQKARGAGEFGAVDNFRVRIMPVLGTVPAAFGMTMASYVLCQLAKQPFLPSAMSPVTKNVAHSHLQRHKKREVAEFNSRNCKIDEKECGFLIGEVWRQKCAYSGARLGHINPVKVRIGVVNQNKTCDVEYLDGTGKRKRGVPFSQLLDGNKCVGDKVKVGDHVLAVCKGTRFTITRWDRSKPPTLSNLLFLTEEMATMHEQETKLTGSTPRMDHGEGQSMVHDTRTLAWISRTLETLVLDENANSAQNPVSSSGGLESSASNLISFGLFGAGVLVGMFAGSMLAKSR
jgi:tRNA A37 threonylcarbamoyladenosine dehydratase